MSRKMKKLEKKLRILEDKKLKQPSEKINKKIMKLEKKKARLEKWLKIKLPFRILIRTGVTWLIIGGVCYGCSYVPVVREIKIATMTAIAYVAPEPVVKVLDVVTLNVGASNSDFEWLKTTLMAYINEEIKLETKSTDESTEVHYYYDGNKYIYYRNGKEVSEEEYKKYEAERDKKWQEQREKVNDVLGTTSLEEVNTMSIPEILMKVATNSTPELISELLDMSNLTEESKQRVEQDINKALKIIPKLNNNQMNELVEIITNLLRKQQEEADKLMQQAIDTQNSYQQQMENEQREMEQIQQQLEQMKNK